MVHLMSELPICYMCKCNSTARLCLDVFAFLKIPLTMPQRVNLPPGAVVMKGENGQLVVVNNQKHLRVSLSPYQLLHQCRIAIYLSVIHTATTSSCTATPSDNASRHAAFSTSTNTRSSGNYTEPTTLTSLYISHTYYSTLLCALACMFKSIAL